MVLLPDAITPPTAITTGGRSERRSGREREQEVAPRLLAALAPAIASGGAVGSAASIVAIFPRTYAR